MSLLNGFGDWSRDWLKTTPYLLDRHLEVPFEPEAGGLVTTLTGGVGVVVTIDGRGYLQAFYRSEAKSLRADRLSQTPTIICSQEGDWETIMRAGALPSGVAWCPYRWDCEAFQVTDGGTYQLARPHAAGIVPGVTSGTHPVKLITGGVEDPTAGTVEGDVLTAAMTGLLFVIYLPIYTVAVTARTESVTEYPVLSVQISLEEVGG